MTCYVPSTLQRSTDRIRHHERPDCGPRPPCKASLGMNYGRKQKTQRSKSHQVHQMALACRTGSQWAIWSQDAEQGRPTVLRPAPTVRHQQPAAPAHRGVAEDRLSQSVLWTCEWTPRETERPSGPFARTPAALPRFGWGLEKGSREKCQGLLDRAALWSALL